MRRLTAAGPDVVQPGEVEKVAAAITAGDRQYMETRPPDGVAFMAVDRSHNAGGLVVPVEPWSVAENELDDGEVRVHVDTDRPPDVLVQAFAHLDPVHLVARAETGASGRLLPGQLMGNMGVFVAGHASSLRHGPPRRPTLARTG